MIETGAFSKKQVLFAFLNHGDKLCFRNDNVVIRDSDGKLKHQSTCYRLFALYIIGNTSITTGLIQRATQFGFTLVLMTGGFRVYEIIGSHREGNTLLHRRQYQYNSWEIGKHIIDNKIVNQCNVLKLQRHKSQQVLDAITEIDRLRLAIPKCTDLNQIMGCEGSAAKLYFSNHFNTFPWKSRQPRIKPDMVNSILDIGYTVLFSFIESLLGIYGFDLYCGVLHRCFYMRKSLVCDLIEPFRPLIDIQVKKSINLGQFKEEDFLVRNHRFELQWKHSHRYVGLLMQPILDRRDEIFKYVQSYYRCFMRQKPIEQFPFFSINSMENTLRQQEQE